MQVSRRHVAVLSHWPVLPQVMAVPEIEVTQVGGVAFCALQVAVLLHVLIVPPLQLPVVQVALVQVSLRQLLLAH